jgi:predicted MPP superfamily phosphohydrolase
MVGLVLLGARSNLLALPIRATFSLVLLLATLPTLFWWSWLDETVAGSSRRWATLCRAILWAYTAFMLVPLVLFLVGRHGFDALPVPVLMWVMAWYLFAAAAGAIGLAIYVPWLVVRGLRWVISASHNDVARRRSATQQSAVAPTPAVADCECSRTGISRRAVLAGALSATPVMVVGSVVAGGLRQQGRFVVRRIEIALPRLPGRLRGLTITHVSDFHVGRFFRPEHLPRVVEAVNRLDSDLIAITGDIVDHSPEFFPPACEAFRQMNARCGRLMVIGNHDLIASPNIARGFLRQFGREFLEDERRTLDIGGERVQIAGLGWSRYEQRRYNVPGLDDHVKQALAGADPDVFTLALAHHPHAFDALARAGVDLTLAGHTHGGQIMLTRPGSPAPVGGGNLLFRYIWGEYRRGKSAMYVTSGVGNWFPVRINAPAEIVQIRLV